MGLSSLPWRPGPVPSEDCSNTHTSCRDSPPQALPRTQYPSGVLRAPKLSREQPCWDAPASKLSSHLIPGGAKTGLLHPSHVVTTHMALWRCWCQQQTEDRACSAWKIVLSFLRARILDVPPSYPVTFKKHVSMVWVLPAPKLL